MKRRDCNLAIDRSLSNRVYVASKAWVVTCFQFQRKQSNTSLMLSSECFTTWLGFSLKPAFVFLFFEYSKYLSSEIKRNHENNIHCIQWKIYLSFKYLQVKGF